MATIPSLLLLLLSFLPLLVILKSEADDQLEFLYHKCNQNIGNFTRGSSYENTRNSLFSRIYSDREINYGFYNFSDGKDPDKVNLIGLCRGDLKPDACRSCLHSSAVLIRERCPIQKEAIGYYDLCMLRYSNESKFGVMETEIDQVYCNLTEAKAGEVYNQTLQGLLDSLKTTAADGDSRRKFAEGDVQVQSSNETIHALVQCTPDLSKQDCTQCFSLASLRYSPCDGKKNWRYIGPSCFIRYENHPFFDPIIVDAPAPQPQPSKKVPPPPPSAITTTSGQGKSRTLRTVLAVVIPVVVIVVLLVLICSYLGARRPRHGYIEGEGEGEDEGEGEGDSDIKTTELLQFDFATIRFATNNFSDENKLGQGGFGTVYKGILSDGQEVAIKRLSNNSDQGETEFKNEVLLTGKLQHRNLVKLLGFCLARRERILIYEFVPNKSLDYIIFDSIKRANLDWERRFKIIRGIARGLLYLHEDSRLQIVHRDMKTSNILLDDELNPKIADFGMARLFDVNQTEGSTMTIVGTFGYMAPEYIKHGQFSVKSDVFSLGVMILEIVCGKKNGETRDGEKVEDLLSFAWKNWTAGTASDIVDPTLNHDSENEIMRCIHIGLLCVQEDAEDRPTMTLVSLMLNSSSFPLPEPSEPPFLMKRKSLLSIPSSVQQYLEVIRSGDSGSQSTQGSTSKASVTDGSTSSLDICDKKFTS